MTTEQQRAANAELARRMRWQTFPYIMPSQDGQWKTLLCPPGERVHISTAAEPPDYFTDPAASRELVTWMARDGNEKIAGEFYREIWRQLELDLEGEYYWLVAEKMLTALPSVIAEAACKALGIEVAA